MTYIAPETFGVNLVRNTPDGELHSQWHCDLCRGVNMCKLMATLNAMVASGHISSLQREAFAAQAGGLLATMLSECARSFVGSPAQSTYEEVRHYGVDAQMKRSGL